MNLFENMGEVNRANESKSLISKWSKTGLLEGMADKNETATMAVLLENQAKQLLKEGSATTAGTGNAGYEQWTGVALPLIRRVYAEIAAKEFVSVQPMNLPSGLVFYLDFKYGTGGENGFAAGENMYGNVSTANSKMSVDEEVSGGLYGAGRFGYSINSRSLDVIVNKGDAVSGSINYQNGVVPSQFYTWAIPTSSLTNPDLEGLRAFRLFSGSVDVTTNPEFTTLSGGNIQFVVAKSSAASAALTGSVTYHVQPADNSRGDFEDGTAKTNGATTISIPEINVTLASEAIVAKTRKLKAQWTPEFAQDLNAYHSLDAEAELTGLLSEHISLEIDLEVLDMLIQNAPTVEYWSAKVGNQINAGATGFDSNTAGVYYTQMSWFQTLGIKLQKVSNIIHQRTLRGGANFMVVSPSVATILESIPGFAADTDGAAETMKYAFGVQKIGQLNSRYKVYKNPYMLENVILMGFRGTQFLECGAVYSPYVPLIMTPLVYDPNTFTPRKGIMTRYAKKMVRPEFYGKVLVADTNII